MKKSFLISLIFLTFFCSCTNPPIEEKVGQLIITYFDGNEYNENAKKLIRDSKIGGIILYKWANALSSAAQVKDLTSSMQAHSKRPLLIAIDHEGGRLNHLSQVFPMLPSQREVGRSGDPSLAYHLAFQAGCALRSVGINFTLGPVVDLCDDPSHFLYFRTFGSNGEYVASFAKQAIDGYTQAGIFSCLKHFPGHGITKIDSHLNAPLVSDSIDQIQNHLKPFELLHGSAPAVMVGHLDIPKLDKNNISTFSSNIISKLLRKDFQFDGLVITDSLVMKAITNQISLEEAAIRAVQAGSDMVIIGGIAFDNDMTKVTPEKIKSIHSALIDAVNNGRISKQRLDDAWRRIISYKNLLKYFDLLTKYPELTISKESRSLTAILEIQNAVKQRYINSGVNPLAADTLSHIGVIAENKFAYRIRDGIIDQDGVSGIITRTVSKADLKLSPGIATLPLLCDDQVLLQLKFQSDTQTWALDIPHLHTYPGESAEEAAIRCLEMETGLRGELVYLGMIKPNPGELSAQWKIFLSKIKNEPNLFAEPSKRGDHLVSFTKKELFQGIKQGFFQTYLNGIRIEAHIHNPFVSYALSQALTKDLL